MIVRDKHYCLGQRLRVAIAKAGHAARQRQAELRLAGGRRGIHDLVLMLRDVLRVRASLDLRFH